MKSEEMHLLEDFGQEAIADLSTPSERFMKELPNACFNFEIEQS